MTSARRIERERLQPVYERGLERCRQGEWQDGLVDLAWLTERAARDEVPALCYSYLGYGLALTRGQLKQGIRLCKHAIKREFYQPECYVNLARTAMLSKRHRHVAANAVLDGLQIDSEHPDLLELSRELGVRRQPVIPLLSRKNFLNRCLGWLRHQLAPGASQATRGDKNPQALPKGQPIRTV